MVAGLGSSTRMRLQLLADGVVLDTSAQTVFQHRYGGRVTLGEYATTGGISLRLPGQLTVNAPIVDSGAAILRFGTSGFTVLDSKRGEPTPVEVIQVPDYADRVMTDSMDGVERPYSSFGITHTDRCRISPIAGCAWKCEFCDLPYELRYRRKHSADLLTVVEAARTDASTPARHVVISGGSPRERDEPWLDTVYEAVAGASPLPVEVMMAPRRDLGHPAWLRRCGVRSLSLNLDVVSDDRRRTLMPQKARLDPAHHLRSIERAVDAFGVGFVQSLIVFGSSIETLEATTAGVRALAERGCIPVLSPFRPHPATPLATAPPASLEEITTVLTAAEDVCAELGTGVRPGPRCVACQHNTVTAPDDDPFYCYADDDLSRPCRT